MVLLCLIFLIQCSNQKLPEVEETVLEEQTKFIDLQMSKEKSIDVSDVDYAYLYLDKGTVNVYGFSIKQTKGIVLKKYDRDLNLNFEKLFNSGQGPGDLGSAPHFFPYGEHIYVPDHTQRRVNIFDKKLNFIKFVKTPIAYLSPIFTKDGKHFIGTEYLFDEKKRQLFHIDIISFPELKKRRIHSFGPASLWNEKRIMIRGNCPAFDYFYRNEKIYLINMKTYQIMIFDLSGQMLKRVKVDVAPIPVPKEKEEAWLKDQQHPSLLKTSKLADYVQPAAWMVPLGKGFVVIRRNSYNSSCIGLVDGDYFNYDLQLLGKVKFPCFFGIYKLREGFIMMVHKYDGGYVYLLDQDLHETDEEIRLEKWKVVE